MGWVGPHIDPAPAPPRPLTDPSPAAVWHPGTLGCCEAAARAVRAVAPPGHRATPRGRGGRWRPVDLRVDGARAAAWGEPRGVELWSRRGHRLTDRYPELGPALAAAVPVGMTVDGEVCAWANGRLDFRQLLRSPTKRRAAGLALSFMAREVLSLPGRAASAGGLFRRGVLSSRSCSPGPGRRGRQ
ncbi:hypothetical protein ACIRPK_35370 [Kitasatospora sp. NPDC101801]|uniref:ATP-dependent DNA ligase n=1 Tax=Kitasatospora sp. NPDC101801 TaxID=3364103 RepID=UPI00382599BE